MPPTLPPMPMVSSDSDSSSDTSSKRGDTKTRRDARDVDSAKKKRKHSSSTGSLSAAASASSNDREALCAPVASTGPLSSGLDCASVDAGRFWLLVHPDGQLLLKLAEPSMKLHRVKTQFGSWMYLASGIGMSCEDIHTQDAYAQWQQLARVKPEDFADAHARATATALQTNHRDEKPETASEKDDRQGQHHTQQQQLLMEQHQRLLEQHNQELLRKKEEQDAFQKEQLDKLGKEQQELHAQKLHLQKEQDDLTILQVALIEKSRKAVEKLKATIEKSIMKEKDRLDAQARATQPK